MKIVLLYLPHPYLRQPNAQVPLGILYLKSVLEHNRNDIDVTVKNYSAYSTSEAISDLPEADIYGITVTSLELPMANDFARQIKEKYSESKVILGGPGIDSHRTFFDYVDLNYISSCVIGEGEHAIFEVIKDYQDSGHLKICYVGKSVRNLNDLPFPDRYCLEGEVGGNIFAYNKTYKGNQSTTILTSRGCPFRCAFCASPKFRDVKPVRFRSPQNVYSEMRFVKEMLGISQFRISDDMFLSRPIKDIELLCKLIKSLDVVWRISTRVKPFDAKIAKMIKDAGCVEASFGVESFDDEVLKGMNKRTTAADNVEALKIAAGEGITSRVLFMIRTPFQTSKTVDINISYLEKTPYDIIACTSFVPLPGSDIWVNPEKYNIEILTKDLSKYNFYFWSKDGENELHDIIRLKGRDLDCLNQETKEFKEYLKSTNKLNMG